MTMRSGLRSLATAGLLVVALALAACGAGAGGAAVAPKSAALPVLGEKAQGPYAASGSVDAAAGRASTQMADTMKFQPNTFAGVKAGQTVTVELKNGGATVHSVVAPALGVREKVVVQPGQTGQVTFSAPSEPGRYQFWCPEPGHAEAGMVGEVIVE
jgi:uncharacterized cupredoxin-like copper-binding protein